MLREHERWIFHYDLHLRAYPPGAPPVPLRTLLPHIVSMSRSRSAVHSMDNSTRAIWIQDVAIAPDEAFVTLLIQYADGLASDPAFADMTTFRTRVERKRENEGGTYSAHVVIELEEVQSGSNTFRVALENVPGVSATRLQRLFRALIRTITTDLDLHFHDLDGKRKKNRPMADLDPQPSLQLQDGLRDGELKDIQLVYRKVRGDALDEQAWVSEETTTVKTTASPGLAPLDARRLIQRRFRAAQDRNAERMVVRLRSEGRLRPIDINLEATSALAALFSKYHRVELDSAIPQASDAIHDELSSKMRQRVTETERPDTDSAEGPNDDVEDFEEATPAP